jgi:hypothetical protein
MYISLELTEVLCLRNTLPYAAIVLHFPLPSVSASYLRCENENPAYVAKSFNYAAQIVLKIIIKTEALVATLI